MSTPEKVAVVGGGFSGLEVANHLAALGSCEVTIFDNIPSQPLAVEPFPEDRTVTTHYNETDHPLLDPPMQARRLGGRSLHYQGVMLEIEESALEHWPSSWRTQLTGPRGMYQQSREALAVHYPYMRDRLLPEPLNTIGLQHTPQALRRDTSGVARIYTPMEQTLGHVAAGRILLVPGQVQSLASASKGEWSVHFDKGHRGDVARGFDACVLAASAVGNAIVLARSLHETMELPITDHIGVGAYATLEMQPIAPSIDPKIWTGYRKSDDANYFVQETAHKRPGHVLVDVSAVLEHTQDTPGRLVVSPDGKGSVSLRISTSDSTTIQKVQTSMLALLSEYRGNDVKPFMGLGIGPYHQIEALAPDTTSNRAWFYLFSPGTFQHESHTTPLGWQSPSLTITEEAEVAQMPGVYVAGPGLFPRLGNANPALSIIATSRILANLIAS